MNSRPTQAHFDSYRLTLLPLCPIHVGSGVSVEPFEYDLDVQDSHGELRAYDLDALLSSLDARQRAAFDQKNNAGYPQVRSWLREQFRDEHLRFQLAVNQPAADELKDSLDDRKRTGEIHLLPRNPLNNRAYLPGSSVKGAIRTALLNAAAASASAETKRKLNALTEEVAQNGRNKGQQARGEQRFQATALDYLDRKSGQRPDLYFDPFRQVALADFPIPSGQTYIDRAQIVKASRQTGPDPGGILIFREMTHSYLLYQDRSKSFESELRLYPQLADRTRGGSDALSLRLGWTDIRNACNAFYRPRLADELAAHLAGDSLQRVRERMEQFLDLIDDRSCLVRIGRHSHFE